MTAIAEIAGCYLPYIRLRKGGFGWLRAVDKVPWSAADLIDDGVALPGMLSIVSGWGRPV